MPPVLDFNDIARLLNFTRTTSIETKPIETGKSWALYEGEHKLPTRSYRFSVLYFNTSAAIEDIKSALPATSKYGDRDVVYPASLQQRFSGANSDISKLLQNTNGARGTRDYLMSFVRNEIQAYLKSIRDQATPAPLASLSGFSLVPPPTRISIARASASCPDLKTPAIQACVGRAYALGAGEQFPYQLGAACAQKNGSDLLPPTSRESIGSDPLTYPVALPLAIASKASPSLSVALRFASPIACA